MFNFLISNIGTIIVLIILSIVVFLIIRYLYRNKKKGKSLCAGGCVGCPMAGKCHPQSNVAKTSNTEKWSNICQK